MRHLRLCILTTLCAGALSFLVAATLDDFEHGTTTNYFKGSCLAYSDRDDGGESDILSGELIEGTKNLYNLPPTAGEGCPDGTPQHGLMMQFKYGTPRPFDGSYYYGKNVGIKSNLTSTDNGFRDITGATRITFKAKASTPMIVRVLIPISTVTDKGYHRRNVTVTSAWKTFSISLDSLSQPTWATYKNFDRRLVQRVQWEIITEDNADLTEGTFWLDDIALDGYDSNVPELVFGPDSTYERKPTFKWHPYASAQSYTIQIDSVPTFNSTRLISMGVTDTTFTCPVNLPFGTIYWRVKEATSSYSATASFKLIDSRIPKLILMPDTTVERQPVFRWHKSPTSVSKYFIKIRKFRSAYSYDYHFDTATVTDTFFQSSKIMGFDTSYIWTVSGDGSVPTPPDTFRVIDGRIPEIIPVTTPTHTRTPVITWHAPRVAVSKCSLQVCTNSNFYGTGLTAVSLTDTFFQVPNDLPLTTIYWRIRGDNSEWSRVSTFSVLTSDDLKLIPIEPTIDPRPTFRWYKPPVPVSSYKIFIRNPSMYTTLVDSATVTDTFYRPPRNLYPGTMYWTITAEGAVGSGSQPLILYDSRIPRIIPHTPKVSTISTPLLSWRSAPNASLYTINLASDPAFSNMIISMPTEDTTFQVFAALQPGTYYWKVKSDLLATFSSVDTFTILPGHTPTLVTYDGAIVNERRPILEWGKVNGANAYHVVFADNRDFTDAFVVALNDTIYAPQIDLAYGTWYWKVSCDIDFDAYSMVDSLSIEPMTGAEPNRTMSAFTVRQNRFGLVITTARPLAPKAISVYDLSGRLVSVPHVKPGASTVTWDFSDQTGRRLSTGVYLVNVKTAKGLKVHRVTVTR